MSYIGDIALESTVDFKFTSRRFSTGAPFTLAGSPVISAYVGNSTTQLTAGITLSVDFDGVTGLNNVRVVATAANGYATASNYQLVITTGTVDSISVVGEVVGQFSIEARSALRPTVVDRTLDVTAGGNAGIDWGNVENPTTALNLSATNIDVDQVVASVTAAVTVGTLNANVITAAATAADFTTEIQTGLATAANLATVAGYLDTEIAAILADTNELQTDWADGGRLDLILDARASQASVNTVDDFLDTEVGAIKTVTDKLDTAVVLDGSVYQFTANALELAPTGGSAPTTDQIAEAMFTFDATATYASANAGSVVKQIADNAGGASLTASDIADEVQTRTIAAVTLVNGLAANTITAAAAAADFTTEIQTGLATAANLATVAGYLDTEIAAILADTNELQTDWANGGRLDVILDARASQASVDVVDGIVDDILIDTAVIGAAGAGLTALATQASVTAVDDLLDTELPALTTAVAAVKTQTDKLAFTVANKVDANTLAINGDAGAAATSAILNGSTVVYRGTVTGAATTSTLIDSGLTESDVDHWKGRVVIFTSVIPMQATSILAFNPTTDQLTFDPTTQAPTGATFVII